jgi:hypothetical protein
MIKVRKNSCVMIIGELIFINSEFQIDIQDMNFLSTSISNIESSTTSTNISSLYSWSNSNQNSGRITPQTMANTSKLNNDKNQSDLLTNIQIINDNNEDLNITADDEIVEINQNNNSRSSRNKRTKRK